MFVEILFSTLQSYFLPDCYLKYERLGSFLTRVCPPLGACKSTGRPFIKLRKSHSFHLRSLKKMSSAFSAPTQAYVPQAGETKLLQVSASYCIMKSLPQFPGPMSMMLLFPFFHPSESALVTASLNLALSILLLSKISTLQCRY